MIDELQINNVASYANNVKINLKPINFFYGSNGTGKTTISRCLMNSKRDLDFNYTDDGKDCELLVYNNDFVVFNFNDNSKIKGIFTLGKDSNEIVNKINQMEIDKKDLFEKIQTKQQTIKNMEENISNSENECKENVWKFKKVFNDKFPNYFKGNVGDKNRFYSFVVSLLGSYTKMNHDIDSLSLRYDELHKNELRIYPTVDLLLTDLINDDYCKLLEQIIQGKKGLEISAFIEKLNCLDWIKEGVGLLSASDGICPFCQNKISSDKCNQLEELFDETYESIIKQISDYKHEYLINTSNIIEKLKQLAEQYDKFLTDDFSSLIKLYEKQVSENIASFEKKLSKPSEVVYLSSEKEIIDKLNVKISELKEKVEYNNMIFSDSTKEDNKIKDAVYEELCFRTSIYIDNCKSKVTGFKKGINNITLQKDELQKQLGKLTLDISNLRSSMSGITSTIEEMNKILESFGFNDFHFVENEDKKTYKILRKDGRDVGKTLSEGEQRFISFLYFYQLVKGTSNENGEKKNRIIVIDDPISSLDSNILFIVSTLVKNIIDDCLKNQKGEADLEVSSGIDQVMILTHNVYFLKEITFRSRAAKYKFIPSNTNFFVIYKNNGVSTISTFDENPINTTYDLLWDELRDTNREKNKGTIFNTMRRILEYYFNILGGLDYEKLISQFEGEDKSLCSSLLSCINDSSHYIPDDYSFVVTDDVINRYIVVFRMIFEKTDQIKHYNMMMHIS